VLAWALDVPPSIEDEDEEEAEAEQATRVESTTGAALAPDPVDNARPWANISTGLSKAEEDADPEFAEALRQSAWVEETGLSADEYLRACDASINRSRTAGPSCIAGPSKVVADDTKPAIPSESETKPATSSVDTAFTLAPLPSPRIIRLAHDESELPLDALMRCVGVDELRRVARARKIPPSMLSTRESTMAALHDAARRQTTLDFGLGSGITDRKGKGKARDTPLLSRRTSKHLVAAELLTLVGDHVLRLDEGLSALIARVNLVFSRTPAVPSQPALLLPPILVASHKRHYPVYGTPIRSRIWSSRAAMLEWERAAGWDALVSDALGDTWAQQRTGSGAAQTFRQGQQMSRSEGARVVRAVWAHVWPVWKAMVAADAPPPDGVVGDRFRTEHVLTRVVYKGAEALGVLHEYDLECEVLRALLAQRRWRRGKRGYVWR
jgi:Fanconi-associated nuclease 1